MTRHTRRPNRACILALIAVWLLSTLTSVHAEKTFSPDYERRVSEEGAKEILGEAPEWANEEQRARCQKLLDEIAKHCPRPDVQYAIGAVVPPEGEAQPEIGGYKVHLLDRDDANAFALPGGVIFVTKGLLEPVSPDKAFLAVQSDDELASILAHEIAHVCHFHGLRQADRAKGLFRGGLVASLATLLLGGGIGTAFQVLGFGQQVATGMMNHYGIDYETEADNSAVQYIVDAGYNPTGLLTFIERLAAEERARAPIELGIYQTHPYPVERIQAIRRFIRNAGINVNRRAVTNWSKPEAMEAIINGEPAAVLVLWERTIYTFFATAPTGESASARAEAAVARVDAALAAGMEEYDLSIEEEGGLARVTARGEPLFTIYPDEVEGGGSVRDAAEAAMRELRAAFFGSTIETRLRAAAQ